MKDRRLGWSVDGIARRMDERRGGLWNLMDIVQSISLKFVSAQILHHNGRTLKDTSGKFS